MLNLIKTKVHTTEKLTVFKSKVALTFFKSKVVKDLKDKQENVIEF